MHGSVTVHIDAAPDAVWRVVSDVTRVGEFSPETFEAEWLDGATGPAVGARFRGHVKRTGRGPTYWTVCDIVACEPERELAFAIVNTYLLILSTQLNTAVFLVFLTLEVTEILLFAGGFANSTGLVKAGGIVGVITAVVAWYASAAGISNGMTGGKLRFPVGPPLIR